MKALLTYLLAGALALGPLAACSKKDGSDPKCGTYNGHQLYKGPKNGCYYINGNGNKEYVAHSFCSC